MNNVITSQSTMDKPWVGIDDPGQIILTGNKAGLDILKASIDEAIVKGEADIELDAEGSNIYRVVCSSRDQYLSKYRPLDSSFKIRVAILLAWFWHVAMPIVAVILITGIAFTLSYGPQKPSHVKCVKPMQNPIESPSKWP